MEKQDRPEQSLAPTFGNDVEHAAKTDQLREAPLVVEADSEVRIVLAAARALAVRLAMAVAVVFFTVFLHRLGGAQKHREVVLVKVMTLAVLFPVDLTMAFSTIENTILFGEMRSSLSLSDEALAREITRAYLAYLGLPASTPAGRPHS